MGEGTETCLCHTSQVWLWETCRFHRALWTTSSSHCLPHPTKPKARGLLGRGRQMLAGRAEPPRSRFRCLPMCYFFLFLAADLIPHHPTLVLIRRCNAPPSPNTSSSNLNVSWEQEQFTTLHGLRIGMYKFGKLIITHSCQSSKRKKITSHKTKQIKNSNQQGLGLHHSVLYKTVH